MDTKDEYDSHGQGRPPEGSFPNPDWASSSGHDTAATGAPRARRRSIIGGLAGQWGRILLVWLVVSAPVSYLVYALVEPTYEATSVLRAEPMLADINGPGLRPSHDLSADRPYLQSQVHLMTSDSVLKVALARPEISRLPTIRSSKDALAEVRAQMGVRIVGDSTYLIAVSMDSKDPEEAALIVNAVVDAYIEQHSRYHKTANRKLKTNLEIELAKLDKKIEDTQAALTELAEKRYVPTDKQLIPKAAGKEEDGAVESSFRAVSEENYAATLDRLLQADFELIDARARLQAARLAGGHAKAERLRELESAVEEAKQKQIGYRRYIDRISVVSMPPSTKFREAMLSQDLSHLRRIQENIKIKLAQIEFEIGQETFRISVQDPASVPKAPSNNNRFAYMAVASIGVYFLILGLFLVRELAATRDAASDATS